MGIFKELNPASDPALAGELVSLLSEVSLSGRRQMSWPRG